MGRGEDCIRPNEVYTVPVTPSGSAAHPSSKVPTATAVGFDPGTAVGVPATAESSELAASSWLVASFARWASMPVPAASPITAADNRAMMHERINTSRVHPQTVRLLIGARVGGECAAAAALYGDATEGEGAGTDLEER